MFSTANIGLVLFLILGMAARSNLLAAAATVLLVLRLTHLQFLIPRLYEPAIYVGLLFLTVAMLAPFALGQVNFKEIRKGFLTFTGVLAVIGGAVATHLNGHGIDLLNAQSHLMVSVIVGSILGIVLWGGIPVGPLTAAGVTYLMIEVVMLVTHWLK